MLNKFAKFMRNTGPVRFLLPIGIAMLVMGIILMTVFPSHYEETAATVTGCTPVVKDGRTVYDVDFDYTVGGKQYSSTFPDQDREYKAGESITIYYDPSRPETISNTKNTAILSVAFVCLGAAAIAYGIYATVKAFRRSREMDEQIKAAAGADSLPEIVPVPREQLTEYYVSLDGHMLNPGYIVEDRDRKLLYEAPMTKNSAFGDRTFTFTNHVTGETAEHAVGHTTTSTYNNEFFSVQSWFSFDGKNIWDVLHDRGVRITTDILSSFPKAIYHSALNGKFFATFETVGKWVHEEDAEQHTLNVPMGRYYYRVWTNETDLDLLFLTIFAVSETDQAIVE